MNKFKILPLLLISLLMFQCADQEYPAQEQLQKDKKLIDAYAAENSLEGSYIFNDIFKATTKSPTGSSNPAANDGVRVKYNMSLLDGTVIDSDTVFYQHGQQFFIESFEASLSSMKKGEVSTFLIPSFYAYGAQPTTTNDSSVTIPANSVIKLDLELFDIVLPKHVPQAYAYYENIEGDTTGSGIFYTITTPGGGAEVADGQTVSVKYKGYLLNGFEFDSGDSFSFVLGSSTVIAGWEEAISLLKIGDKATIVIPSALAYKSTPQFKAGKMIIPANAVLIFDIEVLDAK
ncbi:MAG TPA: FKBP-type peptidyl-prolyl cis-trans isomerase [Cytophagales bacterium]|nr:FKBP-type peptidyl-prolyl cis-trans isomerase [Cytophagales bacterium]